MKKSLLNKCLLSAGMALVCSTAQADFSDVWTSTPSPWSATALETSEIPSGVAACQNTDGVSDSNPHTLHKAETTVVAASETATVTFTYTTGNHMLMIAGVDVVASDGTTIISDYHEGQAGGTHSNNTYTLSGLTANEIYTLRYFVCSKSSGGCSHDITQTNGNITVTGLLAPIVNAKAAYVCSGPGYPFADASSRTNLKSCIDAAETEGMTAEEYSALTTALSTFKTDSNIQLPEDGKAYTIANYSNYNGGTTRYLNYTAGSALSVNTDATTASTFLFKQLSNGQYAIITDDGKILTWMHPDEGYAENGTRYGYSSTYAAEYNGYTDWNDITVKKNGTGETDFGFLRIVGARHGQSADKSSFIIKGTTGAWDRAGDAYFFQTSNYYFSSAWVITEVANYENTDAQNQALTDISKTEAKAQMPGTFGDAVCDYSCIINGEKITDKDTVWAAIDAATTEAEIAAIVAGYGINLPESGKYYRLKGISGNYIDATSIYATDASGNKQMSMKSESECNYEGTIFYLDSENRLKNLSTGTYVYDTRCIGATKEDAGKWTFAEYTKTALYGYVTLTVDRCASSANACQLHDNAGTRADRCTSICGDRHAWKLEEVQLPAAQIGSTDYPTLAEAFAAVQDGETITILNDLFIDTETYTIADGMNITLDLNGKELTVADSKESGNYELFYIYGGLIVTGEGTIELTSVHNREWDAMSAIFHNRGGELTINNGSFANLGGTDMAWVVDNSANYYGDATTNINGGTLTSTYTAIRNRMEQNTHGASGIAVLNITAGTISGTTSAIWAQAASESTTSPATGEINISGGNVGVVNTARSTGAECMTTISGGTVAAFKGEVNELKVTDANSTPSSLTILTATGEDADYQILESGLYAQVIATVGDVKFAVLQEAFEAVEDNGTITIVADVKITEDTKGYYDDTYVDGVRYVGDKSFSVNFGGFTVTDNGCVNDYLLYINNKGEKENEITFSNGTIESKNGCWSTVCVGSSTSTYPTTVFLNDVTIVNSNDVAYSGNQVVRVRGNESAASTVNVNSGTTIISDGASYGIAGLSADAVLNINEGATIEQKNSGATAGNSVFAAVSGLGYININEGAVISSDNYGIYTMTSGNADVTINGGEITATEAALVAATNSGTNQTATIRVIDGTIIGALQLVGSGSSIQLTGGIYDRDVTDFCADNYECVEAGEGYYTVQLKKDDPSTSITEVETLDDYSGVIYDLQGRRVSKAVKGGIYIINGIKILMQ